MKFKSMKEFTVLSGKGGTGKTSLTAALASVATNTVFCDNDVDAADLHLILHPTIEQTENFISGWKATIHPDKCSNCQVCISYCRFGAIRAGKDSPVINPFQCEGCRLCERICPEEAITSEQSSANYWYVSDTRFGKLVHAHMGPGEENSGKLVTQVRKVAKEIAREKQAHYVLNDGPPGIGCATIASLTGTGSVLLVIEPTKSGLHDVERLVELIGAFHIKTFAVINKADIHVEMAVQIESFLERNNIPLLAKIDFDENMVKSMNQGLSIVEYQPGGRIAKQIQQVWEKLTANEEI